MRYIWIGGLILAALIVVATLSCPGYLGENDRYDRAMANMSVIHTALKGYKIRDGSFPESLDELVKPSDGRRSFLDGGQYAITDPWGKQYQFEAHTDAEGRDHIVVWTTTPDGERIQWPRR